MALNPKDEYPGQTLSGDPAYPGGKARNVAAPGDGSGTPFDAKWLNDLWGFLQALLAFAGITPSGLPDTAAVSQYLAALRARFEFVGPDSATANALVRFNGPGGKAGKNSVVVVDDAGAVSGVSALTIGGASVLPATYVVGPASSVDNSLARFDLTTGKLVQGSNVIVDDGGNVSGVAALALTGEVTYPSPKARETTIEAAAGLASGTFTIPDGVSVLLATNSAYWAISLNRFLPHGAVVTRIRALVDPGVGRGAGSRMRLELRKPQYQVIPNTAGYIAGSAIVSVEDSGLASLLSIDSGTISQTIANAGSSGTGEGTVVAIRAGADAAANPDRIHCLIINWTDPGPRNI